MMKSLSCELCNAEAAVYCPSDAAFLCWSCDAKVHEANFLVARHLRRAVCSNCKTTLTGDLVSGVGIRPSAAVCSSCRPASDDDLGSLSSANSSVCISSTTSLAREHSSGRRSDTCTTATSMKQRRRRSSQLRVNNLKTEGIFVNWCGKLGVETSRVVEAACRALRVCVGRWTALPFRICLAASMWLGLRLSLAKSAMKLKFLKRLEEISGVPAKIILAAESKLKQAVRGELEHRRRPGLEEGWAEC